MGAAALSRRRWTSLLLLCVAAILVALAVRVGRDQHDSATSLGVDQENRGRDLPGVVAASLTPEDLTRTIALESGWSIPPDISQAVSEGSGIVGPPAGAAAFGVRQELPEGTASVIVSEDVEAVGLRFLSAATSIGRDSVGGEAAADVASAQAWMLVPVNSFEAPDGLDGEEGASRSTPASLPVLVPDGAGLIEIVVWDRDVTSLDLVVLPSFARPDDGTFVGPAGPSTGNQPSIVPRSEWANLTWQFGTSGCSDGPRQAAQLQALVIHHTVTANTYSESQVVDLLRAILFSHTQLNGWCDIAYNFVVDRFGRIWEARTGSIDGNVIGGHARGFNTATLGVAMLGQHQAGARPASSVPSPAVANAIESLAAWKLLGAGVDPNGTTWLRNRSSGGAQKLAEREWHLVPTVVGHRDLGFTSCPGSHGVDVVAGLPARLQSYLDRTIPYDWSAWTAHDHGPGFAIADARGGLRVAGAALPWSQAPGSSGAAVVAVGGDAEGGYLLADDGTLVGFGAAPAVTGPSIGAAIDLVVAPAASGGWVLTDQAEVRGFGGRPDRPVSGSVGEPVSLALDADGSGYVLDRAGRLYPVGGAVPAAPSISGSVAVDVAIRPDRSGWVLDEAGRLHGYGGAMDDRVSLQALPAGRPVAIVADPTSTGGWVVDRSGQFLPFGEARIIVPVATDAVSADVVDAAAIGTIVGADFRDSDDARYVDQLHQVFLGRPADDGELDLGVTELEQGEREDLVGSLVRTDAWVGSEIDQMYADVLGRSADAAGRAYWLSEVDGGLDVADLGTYFYGSEEYARRSGDSRRYVGNLYRLLLGRDPDASGWDYWVGELTSGRAAPTDVASGFYASIESRRQRAGRLHSLIVGTPLDPTERDELADRLGRLGDLDFAIDLAADASFYDLVVDGPPP